MTEGANEEEQFLNLAFLLEHKIVCPFSRCFAQTGLEARFGSIPGGEHRVRLPLPSRCSASAPSPAPDCRSVRLRLPSPEISVSCSCPRDLNECLPDLLKLVCRAYNHFQLIVDQSQRCLAR